MVQRQPHVLIVGAAYGGISALNNLIKLSAGKPQGPALGPGGPGGPQGPPDVARALRTKPRYTILDERDGFYHTVGAPLGQVNPSYAREFWIRYEDILKDREADEDVQYVQGTASNLDTESKTLLYNSSEEKERSLSYDFLVVATGLRRAFPVVPEALKEDPYLEDVERFVAPLRNASRIVLVGGGQTYSGPIHAEATLIIHSRGRGHRNGRRSQEELSAKRGHPHPLTRYTPQQRTAP